MILLAITVFVRFVDSEFSNLFMRAENLSDMTHPYGGHFYT